MTNSPAALCGTMMRSGRRTGRFCGNGSDGVANAWGLRLESRERLAEDLHVCITLPAPDGAMLCARGSLAIVRRGPGGVWQASMVFDVEQPRLSAVRIDTAAFAD